MDVLVAHGYPLDAKPRPLTSCLRTATMNGVTERARPPFAVGWSISGSQNLASQYAKAEEKELKALAAFYDGLDDDHKRLLTSHAEWAARATIEASLDEAFFAAAAAAPPTRSKEQQVLLLHPRRREPRRRRRLEKENDDDDDAEDDVADASSESVVATHLSKEGTHTSEECQRSETTPRRQTLSSAALRPRDALREVCFALIRDLEGGALSRLLREPETSAFHHDALAPPKDVTERWRVACPRALDVAEALAVVFEREMPRMRSVPPVADVPLTFASWTIQVVCSHVLHASLYGFALGTCCVCLDAVASAAMSTCLHNMFCTACLERAAFARVGYDAVRGHHDNAGVHHAERAPPALGDAAAQGQGVLLGAAAAKHGHLRRATAHIAPTEIWFPCPVCRKVGRML